MLPGIISIPGLRYFNFATGTDCVQAIVSIVSPSCIVYVTVGTSGMGMLILVITSQVSCSVDVSFVALSDKTVLVAGVTLTNSTSAPDSVDDSDVDSHASN